MHENIFKMRPKTGVKKGSKKGKKETKKGVEKRIKKGQKRGQKGSKKRSKKKSKTVRLMGTARLKENGLEAADSAHEAKLNRMVNKP